MSVNEELKTEVTESLKSAVIDLINEHAVGLAGAGLDAKQAGDVIGAYLITAAWMAAAHGKRQATDEAPDPTRFGEVAQMLAERSGFGG